MPGKLYIIATPIGNLEDITLRALRLLKEVDLIACEDTRHTRKLLTHYQIQKPTISYHEHNERERSEELIRNLESGLDVALVTDAGTPLISDPGFRVVKTAIDAGIQVVPVPGASAILTAISASGLPIDEFAFFGFLSSRSAARKAKLKGLAGIKSTLVFYEAPHRIKAVIEDAREVLGNRMCVVARELTKLHEEFIRGPLSTIEIPQDAARGEFVLLIGPPVEGEQARTDQLELTSITKEIDRLISEEGIDQKAALKRIARDRGVSKSEVYRLMLSELARSKK